MKIIHLEEQESVYLVEDCSEYYLLERSKSDSYQGLVLTPLDKNRLDDMILNNRSKISKL